MDQHPHPLEGKYEPFASRYRPRGRSSAAGSFVVSQRSSGPTTGFRLTNSRAAKAIIREMTHDR